MIAVTSLLTLSVTLVSAGSSSPFWGIPGPVLVYQRPIDAMVDVTNDLGVAVLQDYAYTRSNFAFSPYGVASVLVVLYEGARGEAARQIHNTLRLPWNRDITRIGFRDIHRHLRSYFSHEGYLSGLTLNKNHTSLLPEYRRVLRFYGYDVGLASGDNFPPTTTKRPTTTTTTTTPEPTENTSTTLDTTETTMSTMEPRTMQTESEVTTPETTTQETDITRTTALSQGVGETAGTTTEEPTIAQETTTEEDLIPTTTTTPRTTITTPRTTTTTPRTTTPPLSGPTLITLNIPRESTPRPSNDEPGNDETIVGAETAAAPGNEPTTSPTTSPPSPVNDEVTSTPADITSTAVLAEAPATFVPTQPPEPPTTEAMPPTETMALTEPPAAETVAPTEPPAAETVAPTEPPAAETIAPTEPPAAETVAPTESPAAETVAPTELPAAETMAPTEPPAAETVAPTEPPAAETMAPTEPPTAETKAPTGPPTAETMAPTEPPAAETMEPTEPSVAGTMAPTEPPTVETMAEPATETTEPAKQTAADTVTPTEHETTQTVTPAMEVTSSALPDVTVTITVTGLTDSISDNTIADDYTEELTAGTVTTTGVTEVLSESMSGISEAKVKLDTPIPLVYNLSTVSLRENTTLEASNRTKRSISDAVVVFPDISLQLQNGMFDSQLSRGYELYTQLPKRPFLVDGVSEELVPVMSYTAMFPFAYIRRLHAQALEFPLDDERYKLLLLLPVERRGLRQLIYDLSSCSLREIYQALRPTRVQAIIPSFMVEGFVILTPTLQQLGIWDVFDPRRADLSGMSNDPELYVRNIEQAVTVVIRNYVKILDIQTRTMAARATIERFVVTHPFLYFVLDTDTHVALMAGKIVDPLNSRIY